jgi:hypothetical protein
MTILSAPKNQGAGFVFLSSKFKNNKMSTLKKYGLSALAIATAFVAVAFKNAPKIKQPSAASFYYQAPAVNPYSAANVANKANWISNPATVPGCEDGSSLPCRIDVDNMYSHLSGGVRVLNTSGTQATISTTASGSNFIPDQSTSTGLEDVENRN